MELYLDAAATTKIDEVVLKEYIDIISNSFASTGSLHGPGVLSLQRESESRRKIASLLHVKENEIFFNTGATEGNNFATKGIALQYKNRGKTLITSKVEHPSIIECFHQLEKDYGFKCIYLDVNEYGVIDLDDLKRNLNDDVIFVSIMYVNHEVGSIMPIKEISNLIKKYPKIIFHSDITQALGKTPIDLSLLDIATMSAHKIHGIKGSGFIYKKEKIQFYPLISGHPASNALRAGTSNYPSNVVMSIALDRTLNKLSNTYNELKKSQSYLINELSKIDNMVINTNPDCCIPGIVNISIKGYNPEVVIRALSNYGIYVSSRSVCSIKSIDKVSSTLMAMKKDVDLCISSIRISYDSPLNNEEIDYFISCLKKVLNEVKI